MSSHSPYDRRPSGRQRDPYALPDYMYDARDPYSHPRPVPQPPQDRQQPFDGPRTRRPDPAYRNDSQRDQYRRDPRNFLPPHYASNPPQPRGPPPPRPRRPDYDPLEEPSWQPQFFQAGSARPPQHGSGHWPVDEYSTAAGSQHASLNQTQKRPPLGPPPSSRRGPASYYVETPPVHPIVEESDSAKGSIYNSTRSFASSNAVPNGVPDYYFENRYSTTSGAPTVSDLPSDIEDTEAGAPVSPIIPFNRADTRLGHRPESPSDTPVRQASLGTLTKPTLTTVKGGDRLNRDPEGARKPSREFPLISDGHGHGPETTPRPNPSKSDKAAEAASESARPRRPQLSDRARTSSSDLLGSTAALSDASSSDYSDRQVDDTTAKRRLAATPNLPAATSPLTQHDPYVKEALGGHERSGALNPARNDAAFLPPPSGHLSDRVGRRRPPRINLDAVNDAQQRGSLTSLPDLIRRATRLASNLDRGKTASRLGMNSWFNASGDVGPRHASGASVSVYRRSNATTNDMLSSFPPAAPTPSGSRKPRGGSSAMWSRKPHESVALPSESDVPSKNTKRKKRYCGMPLWLLLALIILLILIVAAAILIPVVLVVIPQQRAAAAADDAQSACQSQLSCQNGGASTATSDGSCKCVCVNGYTGSTCGTQSQAGCTTMKVGNTDDATVGSSIPPLIDGAKSNFSIPLDAATLLGLFSTASLSCTSENALVTFGNLARRDAFADTGLSSPDLARRDTATATATADSVATSNGIVFQDGSPSSASSASSAAATSPPSASSSSTASSSTAASSSGSTSTSLATNETTLDFARTAILYIFQSSGQLDNAITAQQSLQTFLQSQSSSGGSTDGSSGSDAQVGSATDVSLGNGATADLVGLELTLKNGTTFGGGGGSS